MKRDLRSTGPGYLDSVGEWGSRPAFELTALHPFEVDPRPGAALPTPSQDINYQRAARPKGDAIYYLINSAPVTLGSPVMQAGDYEGQRVKLLILGADVTVQGGSASGITSDIVISAGEVAVELIWSAQNAQWVFTGGPKSATGSDVTSVFGRTGDVTAQPGDYNAGDVGADPAGTAAAEVASHEAAANPHPQYSLDSVLLLTTGAPPVAYPNIISALAAANSGDTVLVPAGTHVEAGPVTVPAGVTLKALVPGGGTILANPLILSGAQAEAQGLVVQAGAGQVGITLSGVGAVARDCYVAGTDLTAVGFQMSADSTSIIGTTAVLGAMATGVLSTGTGRHSVAQLLVVASTVIAGALIDHQGGTMLAAEVRVIQTGITVGNVVRVAGGTEFVGEDIISSDVTITEAGFRVTGDAADISVSNLRFEFAEGQLAFLADPGVTTGTFTYNGGKISQDAIQADNAYFAQKTTNGFFFENKPGDEGWVIAAELAVGQQGVPREGAFGEGDSTTRGMVAATEAAGGGVLTAITDDVVNPGDGNTAQILPTGAVGDACYFGSVAPFTGLKTLTLTALVPGAGAGVFEYWDGASWVAVRHMAADADAPVPDARVSYAQTAFQRVASEQVRIDDVQTSQALLALTVDGTPVTRYWLRFRVTSAITTPPVLDQVKIGTNRIELQADGLEYFGSSEPRSFLLFHPKLNDDRQGQDPANATVAYGVFITLVLFDGQFNDGAIDGFGGRVPIPEGLDTSRPLLARIKFLKTGVNGGDVQVFVDYGAYPDSTPRDGSVLNPFNSETVTLAAGADRTAKRIESELLVPDAVAGDTLVVTLERDATAGNPLDTFAGNIQIESFEVIGFFWR